MLTYEPCPVCDGQTIVFVHADGEREWHRHDPMDCAHNLRAQLKEARMMLVEARVELAIMHGAIGSRW